MISRQDLKVCVMIKFARHSRKKNCKDKVKLFHNNWKIFENKK